MSRRRFVPQLGWSVEQREKIAAGTLRMADFTVVTGIVPTMLQEQEAERLVAFCQGKSGGEFECSSVPYAGKWVVQIRSLSGQLLVML